MSNPISFIKQEQLTYCKILIQEVLKPIFLNQSKIYQRAGNMTQLLKGDEIAWFIEERFRKRLKQEGTAIPVLKPESIDEVIDETVKSDDTVETDSLTPIPKPQQKDEKIWYWMSFYQDGTWSFDSKPSRDTDKIYEVSIPASLKNERLIMAYKNGCVNVVIPYDQIKPKGKNGKN